MRHHYCAWSVNSCSCWCGLLVHLLLLCYNFFSIAVIIIDTTVRGVCACARVMLIPAIISC
jgi:hypothetical protein